MVHPNKNEKQYVLIKNEIENVKKIINNDYDIRHNEDYRSEDKSKRETLALLYVLRLKYKPYTDKKLQQIDIDNLPF